MVKSFFLIFFVGHDDGRDLVLYVAWSLTYEVIFYFLAPFLMIQRVRKSMIFVIPGLFLLLAFLFFMKDVNKNPFFVFLAFFCEFLLGYVVYVLVVRLNGYLRVKICMALVFAIVGLALGCIFEANLGPARTFTFGLFAFGIVSLALLLESGYGVTSGKYMMAMGDASYALYLCHTVLFSIFGYIGLISVVGGLNAEYRFAGVFLIFSAILLFSLVYFEFVERPIYRFVSRIISNNAGRSWTPSR
jgi:exopolysaccharide production protein ExoZ